MRQYFLYRLSLTGSTLWKYIRADQADAVEDNAKLCMATHVLPGFPTFVYSERHGKIACKVSDTPLQGPGPAVLGIAEDTSVVFVFQRRSSAHEFLLTIGDGAPFQIWGDEEIRFSRAGKTVVTIAPAPSAEITDGYCEGERVKRLELADEVASEIELICAAGILCGLQE